MNIQEFETLFKEKVKKDYRTKDIDEFNKYLIKNNIDVSFLKDELLKSDKFNRTYFKVMLSKYNNIEEKLEFIEQNEKLLNDWWHVDQLPQFLGKSLNLELAYEKAKVYVESNLTFTRRWGYVIFMPSLVKDKKSFDLIVSLLKNDNEYYVIMAEAWLISYLAIYHPEKTYKYLSDCNLNYDIVGRAIQKICDSFRIDIEYKNKVKEIRKKYK